MTGAYQKRRRFSWSGLFSVLLFAAMLTAFLFGVQQFSTDSIDVQRDNTYKAIRRALVQCYALEGAYPRHIGHLQENYGLIIDESKFFVHYAVSSSNLFPDVILFDQKKGAN